MSKSTNIRICQVTASTERIAYRTPMKFGGRVVTDAVLLHVEAEVETADGRRGHGFGSMPLGNAWAWPSTSVSSEATLRAMTHLGKRLAEATNSYSGSGHPLEIVHDLESTYEALAGEVTEAAGLAEPMPRLAQLVAASPLDAALHDAYGRALQRNAYNLLGPEFANHDLAHYLTAEFQGEYLDKYTLREPKPRMPLYHLVGALDPLTEDDLDQRLDDGLPETLGQWILADGLTHLKIKLAGDDLAWDVQRVARIDEVAEAAQARRKCDRWFYSLDFNEKCADVQYVLDFLEQLRGRRPAAFDRVQYIEQPTHRDLRSGGGNRMHAAAAIKPVVIDESLIDLESLMLAREQGYSGVALKACKGHGSALMMGAAAQKFDLFLCIQDLTCVGASFLHSASLAARVPSVAAIEGNGRQYCPAGNRGWESRYPSMFEITDGTVGTSVLDEVGLGFSRS